MLRHSSKGGFLRRNIAIHPGREKGARCEWFKSHIATHMSTPRFLLLRAVWNRTPHLSWQISRASHSPALVPNLHLNHLAAF